MDIYFSCSITGGWADQEVYQNIVDYLTSKGHHVLTAHLSRSNVMRAEMQANAAHVYQRDIDWIHQCDLLVAEVSTPSHGVGYEIAIALSLDKPVLCCYRFGKRISKMILGNTHPKITVFSYEQEGELPERIDAYLAQMNGLKRDVTVER